MKLVCLGLFIPTSSEITGEPPCTSCHVLVPRVPRCPSRPHVKHGRLGNLWFRVILYIAELSQLIVPISFRPLLVCC